MEILFHRYGSICEPDIIEAFRSLGVEVIEEDREIYEKNIPSDVRIKILAEQILTKKPAFVFSINYFPYISEICQKLNVMYVCLSVDCPVLEFFSMTIRNRCNRIFLFDYNQYLQFREENPECIFYLPLGTNTDRWDESLASVKMEHQKNAKDRWLYDVSMVGSKKKKKSPYDNLQMKDYDRGLSDGLIEAQLQFPGLDLVNEVLRGDLIQAIKTSSSKKTEKHWNAYTLADTFADTDRYVATNYYLAMRVSQLERIRLLNELAQSYQVELFTRSDTSSLKGVNCHSGVSTHKEMPLIFYKSKINLNITIRSIQTGLSQRIWDVLGCGGFLLTNYQAEIPEYLQVGQDLECYENAADLKEKVAYYLRHEDVRMEIARHGYETVKAKHTCRHRVAEILKIVLTMHL